ALMLAREQRRFRKPQTQDDRGDGQGNPQDDVHPERGLEGKVDKDRRRDQQRADDERQKRRGAVTDIIGAKVETAGAAARREADGPLEQRLRTAAGAEAKKGSAPDRRLPFWIGIALRQLSARRPARPSRPRRRR